MSQDFSENFADNAEENAPGVDPTVENDASNTPTDNKGVAFDPSIHKTYDDGSPKFSRTGNLMRKKGFGGSSSGANNVYDEDKAYRHAAQQASGLFISLGSVFTSEFVPNPKSSQDKKDKAMLDLGFENYFRAHDVADFPPGIGLCVAMFMYAAPRLQGQEAQSKIQRIASKFKKVSLFSKITGFFKKRKIDGSQSDNRSSGEREDDVGQDYFPEVTG